MLFNAFDTDRDGYINYYHFIKAIRGEMNDYRKELVERVFVMIDRNNEGIVDKQEIKQMYNAKKHPDVM